MPTQGFQCLYVAQQAVSVRPREDWHNITGMLVAQGTFSKTVIKGPFSSTDHSPGTDAFKQPRGSCYYS